MKEFFTVINEATDISNEMSSFSTDEVTLELTAAQTLSIGFRKAFAFIYLELSTPNTNAATLSATYENAEGVQELELIDETYGCTRSGFLKLSRPEDIIDSTVATIEKKFIKIKTSADFSVGTKLKGVGIVFCTNQDLIDIRSNVIDKLNGGNSMITKIALARDHIMNEINRQGNFKVITDSTSSLGTHTVLSEVNEFDFLKIDQLRLACAYKAMALLLIDEKSDQEKDKWEIQGYRYDRTAGRELSSYFMNLDLDDDGKEDLEEVNQTSVTRLTLD